MTKNLLKKRATKVIVLIVGTYLFFVFATWVSPKFECSEDAFKNSDLWIWPLYEILGLIVISVLIILGLSNRDSPQEKQTTMYKTVDDFYGRDISVTFDLIHKQINEGSVETKEEKITTVKVRSSVTSVASSEDKAEWHITIEKTFFYGYLTINNLCYNSVDNKWSSKACTQEDEAYNYRNCHVAENIKVEIL